MSTAWTETRELRSHAPLGRIKSIAAPGCGPIGISAPDGAPVSGPSYGIPGGRGIPPVDKPYIDRAHAIEHVH